VKEKRRKATKKKKYPNGNHKRNCCCWVDWKSGVKRERGQADDIECVWRRKKKEAKRKEATNMRKLTEW
jgi:hypothetical protein